jgi:hypothetical protein
MVLITTTTNNLTKLYVMHRDERLEIKFNIFL